MIRTYAATAHGSDVIVHGFFVDGVLRGAADLRIFGSLYRREAEAAFSIEKPWQTLGIGVQAAPRSLLAARNPRRQAPARMLPRGEPAHAATCPQIRGRLTFDFGTVIGKVENPHPTPLSVMQELVVDGQSFAAAYVNFQSRLLNPAGAFSR